MRDAKANYTVSKHAALSLSEWLAANYRPKGIRVSCFCPAAMVRGVRAGNYPWLKFALSMDAVTDILVRGIAEELFYIGNGGPSSTVAELAAKGTDYEVWLGTMSDMVGRV